ncbi:MAG: MFS family permease [Oceanospirillaceae bacterium]|jgi:MFS family permease
MTATLLSLLALFSSGFVIMSAHGLINILLPSRLSLENVSADNIGLIMSMFSVGLLLGGIYTRRLIIHVGHIRVYAASAAMAAISILICYLWLNEWLWAVMRILMGFCIASTNIVADGWLSERATSSTRARILATNQIVLLSAMFLGSFMINLADISHATLYIMAGLLLCGGVVPIAMSSASAPDIDDAPSMPLHKLINTSPVGVMAVFMCGLILGSLLSMLAVYAKVKGITGFNVSLLVGAAIIGGVILQYPIGYLADRYERRKVMLNIVLVSMICTALIPFVIDLDLFILALVLVGLSSGIISSLYPLGVAETFDRLQQNEMGRAIGAMFIIYASGGIIGPYTVGLVMEHSGVNSFFIFMAVMQFFFALFIVYRSRVRQSIPTDQQEAFVAQGATGWVSTELDPRTEYVDNTSLSAAAQTAVDIALVNPALALDMVSLIAKASPNQVIEVAGALAAVDTIDVTELYKRLNEIAPEDHQELVQTIITATPDYSTELVSAVFDEAESADIAELATAMTEAAPEESLEIIEAATEAVLEDNPEMVVDIAETYLNSMTDSWEEMRYADRLADDGEQTITDMVSMIAEKAPEQVEEVAAIISETDIDTNIDTHTDTDN